MQLSTILLSTLLAATTALAAPGQCKPPVAPTPPPVPSGCDGVEYCCSQGLQGNVAYYCGDGPAPVEGCGTFVKVCCDKDAGKDLTPRGYTYTGCTLA